MKNNKNISIITLFLSIFLLPGFGNNMLIQQSESTSLIANTIGLIIGIIFVLIIIKIKKNCNNKIIYEINDTTFIGKIINIVIIIYIIYLLFIGNWLVNNFIISQYLTRSSYYLIAFINATIISIIACKKIDVINRISTIFLMIFILFTIISIIFLVPITELDNIYPVLNLPINSIIKSTIYFVFYSTTPLILLFGIKNEPKKSTISGYLIGAIIIITFLYLIISIFGIDLAKTLAFPEYLLFRKIKAFDFIERIENVVSIVVFITFTIGYVMALYNLKKIIKIHYKKPNIKTIIFIINYIISMLSIYIFKNYNSHFILELFPYISIIMLIIIIIEFFISKKLINNS